MRAGLRSTTIAGAALAVVILGLGGMVSVDVRAQGKTANVYTTEYFSDINPLRERTYVATWLSALTAHRLYRGGCVTGSGVAMLAECGMDREPISRNQLSLRPRPPSELHRCHFPDDASDESQFLKTSVGYTVELLGDKRLQSNLYFANRFRLIESGRYSSLHIGAPPNIGESGRQFLDFPLFKKGNFGSREIDATSPVAPERYAMLNEITYGPFELDSSSVERLSLRLRGDPIRNLSNTDIYDPGKAIRRIEVINALESRLPALAISASQAGADVAGSAHAFLNVSPILAQGVIGGESYVSTFAPQAGGPFYLGFNYRASNRVTELFRMEEFRQLLAHSIWDLPMMAGIFRGLDDAQGATGAPGSWRGQTLLALEDGSVVRRRGPQLRQDIQSFLERNTTLLSAMNLRIWVTPQGRRLLPSQAMSQLQAEFADYWTCRSCGSRSLDQQVGVFLRFLPDDGPRAKEPSGYDIVIDRMVHAERLSKIANYFEPGDPNNLTHLGEAQLTSADRQAWRAETTEAKVDMTRWLKKGYHVVVLGDYEFRDLYYRPMVKQAVVKYCGVDGELMHPLGATHWQLE